MLSFPEEIVLLLLDDAAGHVGTALDIVKNCAIVRDRRQDNGPFPVSAKPRPLVASSRSVLAALWVV